MLVTFMVDGEVKHEAEMDAVPRVGERVWFRSTRGERADYTPAVVTAVDWHVGRCVELRLSTPK